MPTVAASPEAIARAAAAVQAGELVAFPTETVYGLGGDAGNAAAVAKIFAAKGRPRFNPLIVHVGDVAAARRLACFGATAEALAAAFWPGALTIVAKRRRVDVDKRQVDGIADLVTAGLETVALRVPAHPIAQQLLAVSGRALAAPSANRSGHVSATRAEHVAADLGDSVAMVLDGGPCRHGLESTIVDATGDDLVILRHGAITVAEIAAAVGREVLIASGGATQTPTAPGQLESHYAPGCAVRMAASDVRPGEALLAFGPRTPEHDGPAFNLSPSGDLVEAAANLFSALRELDRPGVVAIAAMAIPEEGLGRAINDRLRRAAAPRPG